MSAPSLINKLVATLISCSILFSHSSLADSTTSYELAVKARISIVIDDLGDNSMIAKKMLSLPGKMTAAILPHTPYARLISNFAAKRGHDIIMHLPMEAFTRPDLLGPGALLANMDWTTFIDIFNQDVASIPNIIGFNNHMGSLLTEDVEKMQWLMSKAKNQSFLFLDSKTSEASVAENVAHQYGVPSIGRDVFLDHKGKNISITTQFERLKNMARKNGRVVVICHPYPETLEFLTQNIGALAEEFELVGLSDIIVKNQLKVLHPFVAR